MKVDLNLTHFALALSGVILMAPIADAAFRSFDFDAQVKYVPLLHALPNHTAIYHEWPPKKLRKTLPNYISAAIVASSPQTPNDDLPLIGPPIHVQTGDVLSVTLKNSLSTTGLSLHWHGFEMTDALEYDGVVGVTQCPISPYTQFVYEFAVNETPGTYWWHTHSGPLGVHAVNSIHGPLIVHPKGEYEKQLVDRLNGSSNDTDTDIDSTPWYYENDRILFLKDGHIHPDALHLEKKMGGLNEAVSKDDSGYTVGTSAWEFGTCNGRMREIVPVSPGKTYRFRLINGGVHYGLRVNIADLKMTVIAADSEPVEPVIVNEVFLHVAERFDVEVTIPNDWVEGESFWIRADSLESAHQGYQNGVRAILSVSGNGQSSLFSHSTVVHDPNENIRSPVGRSKDHLTMNCFERKTFEGAPYGGRCLQITTLSQSKHFTERMNMESYSEEKADVHFIDSHFQPYPQHSHFIRLDDGPFYQNVNPMKSMLDTSFGPADMHPNTAVLHVPAFSTVVLVWRTTSLMDHPMHLHGLKMEILDISLPVKQEDCTLSKCQLNSFYESHNDVHDLVASIPPHTAVLKDTFVIPAGGAVVTRIHTQDPSLWYSHCHMEIHHFDGMSFILNVGNYSGSSSKRVLPKDYPSCESPFVQAHMQYPSCDCYENPNTVLSNYLTADYKCSRDHLCQHQYSRAANLENYPFVGGDDIHSSYKVPGWAISFISVTLTCLILMLVRKCLNWANFTGSASQPKTQLQRYNTLQTQNTKGSINLATQQASSEPALQSKEDHMRTLSNDDSEPLGSAQIPEDTSQLETQSTRNITQTYRTSSTGSFLFNRNTPMPEALQREAQDERDPLQTHNRASTLLGFGRLSGLSVGRLSDRLSSVRVSSLSSLSAVSNARSSCSSIDAITAEFLSQNKGVPRKDFMFTYERITERSWADTELNDASSIEPYGRSTRDSSSSFLSSATESSNRLSGTSDPPLLSTKLKLSGVSSLGGVEKGLSDEKEEPKLKGDLSFSTGSGLSEPPQSPKEPICAAPEIAQSGTQNPSRRVKFRNTVQQQFMFEEEGGKDGDSAVHTARPVFRQPLLKVEEEEGRDIELTGESSFKEGHGTTMPKRTDASSPFIEQLRYIILAQYKIYRPLCVNGLRVFEVCSLGILTGFLFYDVGNNTSFQGLSERLSLFFFSTTLWTFTRMYPSVGFSYQWCLLAQVEFKKKQFSLGPVVLGRLIVVLGLESFWPLIYAFVCYPFASVFGSIKIVILVGLFLLLNNLCYISLGSVFGVYLKRVPQGMIASTIISQTSLVAAGFFTKLPPALDWIRYISPFYWCFRGILKSCFKWNDTLECFKGTSEVGANQCYLEYHTAIDQYKSRGINVATYNDPKSNAVYLEYICLVLLLLFMNFLIFLKAWSISKGFERKSIEAFAGTEGRPGIQRMASVTDVILARLDSSMRSRNQNESRSISQRFRDISRSVSSRFMSEEEAGAANEDEVLADSTREHVLARLQSSNVLTWK